MATSVNDALQYTFESLRHIRKGDIPSAVLILLIELGFSPQSDGFGYLRKAICRKCVDPDQRLAELYACIGGMYTPQIGSFQVEQAIRSAIGGAWDTGKLEIWAFFFPKDREGNLKRPSNGEFISRLACMLELWSICREA